MPAQVLLVEGFDADTEVVDVVACRRTAVYPDGTVDIQEVDDEVTGPQLVQPDLRVGLLNRTAENRLLEVHTSLDCRHAQDGVIERLHTKH